jgi:hypothetical protein
MPVARRELYLGHGRVFVETPLLMTDDELASVFEAFVKEVRGRAPKGPAEAPLRRNAPAEPGNLPKLEVQSRDSNTGRSGQRRRSPGRRVARLP